MKLENQAALEYLKAKGFIIVFIIDLKRKRVVDKIRGAQMINDGDALPVSDEESVNYLVLSKYIE